MPRLHATQLHRATAALVLLAYLPACTSWQVVGPQPEQFVQQQAPGMIRVTRVDGTRVQLAAPEVRGDTLVGSLKDGTARDTARQLGVPLSEVGSVQVRKFSAMRTLGLVAAVFGATVVVYAAACIDSDGERTC